MLQLDKNWTTCWFQNVPNNLSSVYSVPQSAIEIELSSCYVFLDVFSSHLSLKNEYYLASAGHSHLIIYQWRTKKIQFVQHHSFDYIIYYIIMRPRFLQLWLLMTSYSMSAVTVSQAATRKWNTSGMSSFKANLALHPVEQVIAQHSATILGPDLPN